MKTTKRLSLPAVLALAAFMSAPAQAQDACGDIEFTGQIIERFPNADAACLGIVEREGEQFAKFSAIIQRVSGNNVSVRFAMPDGSTTNTYTFDVDSSARVEIDGREYRYRDLGRGSQVNVYLPHDRWEVHVPHTDDFAVARTVAVVTPMAAADDDSGSVAMLPKTASPMPLIGMLGALFTGLGFVLLGIRRRLSK